MRRIGIVMCTALLAAGVAGGIVAAAGTRAAAHEGGGHDAGAPLSLDTYEDASFWMGAAFVMQVHYSPIAGEPVADRTEFGLYLSGDPSPQDVSWGERTVDEIVLAFVAVSLRFPDDVLSLFPLVGRDPPHAFGLRPLRASKPPQIRSATIDRKGRLQVRVKRLRGGGRIEVDGVPVGDGVTRARNPRRLRVPVDEALGDATDVVLRVRRADGRLSHPFPFSR